MFSIPPFPRLAHNFLRGRTGVLLLGTVWALCVLGGFFFLYREQFTPVMTSNPPAVFPSASALVLSRTQPTLILFVHPHCPCTEATFRQLDQILLSAPGRLSLVVVFAHPVGVAEGWEEGDLLQKAWALLGGAQIFLDKGNVECGRFKIIGSGHTLVYSPGGHLLFSGGITASRGHDGDSLGRIAITSLALTGKSTWHQTPVFGCSLN